MTIKNRNRLNFVFAIISVTTLALSLLILLFQIITKSITIPQIYPNYHNTRNIIVGYYPFFTIFGIIFLLLYITITSFSVWRTFSKTQSSEIVFFLLFLFACFTNSFRLAIPLMHLSISYSRLLLVIGNLTLFSKFLAPLSMLGIAILSEQDQRTNLEQNVIIVLIASLFFAIFIPINTVKIDPSYTVFFGYKRIFYNLVELVSIISVLSVFLKSKREFLSQNTTIGFLLLDIGYQIMFYCYSLFTLILSIGFMISGTIIFLYSLHKQYLWNN